MAPTQGPTAPVEIPALRRWRWAVTAITMLATVVITAAVSTTCGRVSPAPGPPLHKLRQIPFPGDSSRYDYAGLDSDRGLLFLAHLRESQMIEVDVHAHRVVRTISGLSQVRGVLVVPERHRVYATATGTNQMVALDEDTEPNSGAPPPGTTPTAWPTARYRPRCGPPTNPAARKPSSTPPPTECVAPWTWVVQSATSPTTPASRMMLVEVQSHNSLAVIDPTTLTIVRQVPLPGCQHDHGLALDPADRLAFVACDANATLLSVDLTTWRITGSTAVGADPDVLAYDPMAHRLYVAAESGVVTTLNTHHWQLTVLAREHVGEDAHVVAVDPTTGWIG
jgi:DNA-binding beta-propeller fold protein YncE